MPDSDYGGSVHARFKLSRPYTYNVKNAIDNVKLGRKDLEDRKGSLMPLI
jgi:hypothetical protein